MQEPQDCRIIETAEDATITKFAAVKSGYYHDPFVGAFHSASQHHRRQQRPVQVIIKRGTFARVSAVSKAIRSFLDLVSYYKSGDQQGVAQLVVLGAGKDTTYFRFLHGLLMGDMPSSGSTTSSVSNEKQPLVRWVEVDHLSVLQEKATVIENSQQLLGLSVVGSLTDKSSIELRVVGNVESSSCCSCHLVSHDLRLDPQVLCQKLIQTGMVPEFPTFFVSECVLMYLPENASRSLLSTISKNFPQACLCLYEPILKSDPFGQMMQSNLTKAGVVGSDSCLLQSRSLASHLTKLSDTGFVRGVGCDMNQAYETILSADERRRANQCEFLDELEEFVLIMQHYCFVVGCTEQSRVGRQLCQSSGSTSPLGFTRGRFLETGPTG